MPIKITIDGTELEADADETILQAADRAGIHIPRLCYRPGLPSSHDLRPSESGIYREGEQVKTEVHDPFDGCKLCIVEIDGQDIESTACDTKVTAGMVVKTRSQDLLDKRKVHLSKILKDHPHVCLTCAQKEGCSRTQCSANVPDDQKCCIQLGNCEVEKVADFIGISPETPQYLPQGLAKDEAESLFVRDYNFCIGCLRCVRACSEVSGVRIPDPDPFCPASLPILSTRESQNMAVSYRPTLNTLCEWRPTLGKPSARPRPGPTTSGSTAPVPTGRARPSPPPSAG